MSKIRSLRIGLAGSLLAGAVVQAVPATANMGICLIQRQPFVGDTPTAPATDGTGVGYGYVYDAGCDADPGDQVVADPAYQYNSTGNLNHVDHVDVGVYVVRFVGLGAPGGVAHVTAYGPDLGPAAPGTPPQTGQCKVASWQPDDIGQMVTVRCFTPSGQPTDRQFTASYTNMRTTSGDAYEYGYLFANDPTALSYTPDPAFQYSANAGHPLNTIVRTGIGQYTVTLTGLSDKASNGVLVSAAGIAYDIPTKRVTNGGVTCQVGYAYGSTAKIGCYSGGKPADSQFTLTYAGKGNILEAPNRPATGGVAGSLPSSYTRAAGGTTGTPPPNWTFSTGGVNTLAQSYDPGTGTTKVTLPPYTGWGDVQVVAYGDKPGYCGVVNWSDQAVNVQCWDGYGTLATLPFNVFFTGQDW